MVEVAFKPDVLHPGRYTPTETQFLTPDGGRWRIVTRSHAWRPPTDVYETEDDVSVRVEVAGMKETDFAITLQDRYLAVRGLRADTSERRAYHQMEIPFGEFITEVELPAAVSPEGIEASYRDGFLRIHLPKARPRQIKIVGE
jgi:HSP20 family protein